jgi:hypothetical protein
MVPIFDPIRAGLSHDRPAFVTMILPRSGVEIEAIRDGRFS